MKVSFSATSYLRPIRSWAMANNIPFFTWKEIKRAMTLYEIFQAIKN